MMASFLALQWNGSPLCWNEAELWKQEQVCFLAQALVYWKPEVPCILVGLYFTATSESNGIGWQGVGGDSIHVFGEQDGLIWDHWNVAQKRLFLVLHFLFQLFISITIFLFVDCWEEPFFILYGISVINNYCPQPSLLLFSSYFHYCYVRAWAKWEEGTV